MISNECISRIKDLSTYWEKEPMSYYLKQKNYLLKHNGFWKSLDTLKDKNEFKEILKTKKFHGKFKKIKKILERKKGFYYRPYRF